MPVMVVRHAHAMSRSDWDGDDADRPLTAKGIGQAALLVPRLVEAKPSRVLSSPYLRCVETVRPVASTAGLRVEEEPDLAEGNGRPAVQLLRDLAAAGVDAVLCSHGDVIPEILVTLANEDGVDLGPAPRVQKASVWVLHAKGRRGRFASAVYLAPPQTSVDG